MFKLSKRKTLLRRKTLLFNDNVNYNLNITLTINTVFPPKAGFFHDEIDFPEGGNDISDKTVWKLAYKQDYC